MAKWWLVQWPGKNSRYPGCRGNQQHAGADVYCKGPERARAGAVQWGPAWGWGVPTSESGLTVFLRSSYTLVITPALVQKRIIFFPPALRKLTSGAPCKTKRWRYNLCMNGGLCTSTPSTLAKLKPPGHEVAGFLGSNFWIPHSAVSNQTI